MIFMSSMFIMCLVGCNSKKEEEEKMGKFYTLQEAYEYELLTVDDLKNIAYLYNNKIQNGLTNKEIEEDIKKTYLIQLQESISNAKIEDVYIKNYYGTYDDCIVVCVWDNCIDYDLFFEDVKINSIIFKDYCTRCIFVYKKL